MKKYTNIVAILVVFLLFGCEKNDESFELDDNSINLLQAKEYYAQNFSKVRSKKEEKLLIFWEDGKEFKNDKNETFVSVPYVNEHANWITLSDSRKENNKDSLFTADIKTNFIFKKVNGKIDYFRLKLIRDEEENEKKKIKFIEKSSFEGYAYLFDANDNFIEMSLFKNGKAIASTISKADKKQLRPNEYPVTVCVTYYSQSYSSISGYGPVQSETVCETTYISGSSSTGGTTFSAFATLGSIGGSGTTISSFAAFQNYPDFNGWRASLNDDEENFFLKKPYLIPGAITAFANANLMMEYFYCRNGDDGNWNAFKHAFWIANNAMLLGTRNALDIGTIHEKGRIEFDGIVRVNMDLFNNQKGLEIFQACQRTLSLLSYGGKVSYLADMVLLSINNGQMVRILPGGTTTVPTNNADRCK